MGLRVLTRQKKHYPPITHFRTREPRYNSETDAWHFYLPQLHWETHIKYDSNVSTPPVPAEQELWQVGIVQNVLFEHMSFEYKHGRFWHTWPNPISDVGSDTNRPFVHAPVVKKVELPPIRGESDSTTIRLAVLPSRRLLYGPAGVVVMGPRAVEHKGVRIPLPASLGRPFEVHYADLPRTAVRARFGRSTFLRRASRLTALQFWVIALSPGGTKYVLAHSPPFTLVVWAEIPQWKRLSIPPIPDAVTWGSYSHSGIVKRVIRAQKAAHSSRLQPQPGTGRRQPVLSGPTANERGPQWLCDKNLAPPAVRKRFCP